MIGERYTGKDFQGDGRGLNEVLPTHILEELTKNKYIQGSRMPGFD
jgi:hypothetical protein